MGWTATLVLIVFLHGRPVVINVPAASIPDCADGLGVSSYVAAWMRWHKEASWDGRWSCVAGKLADHT